MLIGHFGLFPLASCERKKAGLLIGHFVHHTVVVDPLLAERPVHAEYDAARLAVDALATPRQILHTARPAEPGRVVLDAAPLLLCTDNLGVHSVDEPPHLTDDAASGIAPGPRVALRLETS